MSRRMDLEKLLDANYGALDAAKKARELVGRVQESHANLMEANIELAGECELLKEQLTEARAAFDSAMEYADSAYVYTEQGIDAEGEPYDGHTCVDYGKPRPVAPWKGE